MPPTILAPVSFNGATLRKLDSRAGIAKVSTFIFKLQCAGPVMSSHMHYFVKEVPILERCTGSVKLNVK